MRRNKSFLLLFLLLPFIFFSCVPQKKVTSVKKELTTVNNQLQQYETSLQGLDAERKNKQQQNEIDDTASVRFQRFIDTTNAEIKTLISENTILIGETIVNKADWERLNKTLFRSQQASNKINQKVMMLTDLINRNTVIKLDQDLLFEPGQYTVTPAVTSAIGKFFEPAAKEIDLFVKKYPDFPLSIVITAKGYADGTSIAEGSTLYKNLMDRLKLNANPPDNKELNKELSRARAEAVIVLFQNFSKTVSGNYLKNVIYFKEGKGEAPPDPKIIDYKANDSRRRVVLVYWSVFPE